MESEFETFGFSNWRLMNWKEKSWVIIVFRLINPDKIVSFCLFCFFCFLGLFFLQVPSVHAVFLWDTDYPFEFKFSNIIFLYKHFSNTLQASPISYKPNEQYIPIFQTSSKIVIIIEEIYICVCVCVCVCVEPFSDLGWDCLYFSLHYWWLWVKAWFRRRSIITTNPEPSSSTPWYHLALLVFPHSVRMPYPCGQSFILNFLYIFRWWIFKVSAEVE